MKKTLAFAAATLLTSISAQAAFIFTADNGGSTQPITSRVYGTLFSTTVPSILDKFAIYDYAGHEGEGWTAANTKVVSLYSLSGSLYTQIATKTLTTAPGAAINTLVGAEDFHVSSFAGLGVLPAGNYFIGFSEIKPVGQEKFDGFVLADSATANPAALLAGLGTFSFGTLANTITAVPADFTTAQITGTSSAVGIVPSLTYVPEAGSSVMALALGAMVVRFRSRRA
jgi:hypothetical protein